MHTDPHRPHLGKTSDQLAALDEWLQGQIQALAREREMIQAELRLRDAGQAPQVRASVPAAGGEPTQLNYLTPQVALARSPAIEDPYADNARRYALHATLIGGAIVAAAATLFCIIAARI